jgi:pilus assembly protein CpaF
MINNVLIGVSILVFAILLFVLYQRAKMRTTIDIEDDYSTINQVLEAVKVEMVEIIKEDYSLGLSDSEFNALYKRKARINEALRNCVHGIDGAKVIVTELIRGFIAKNVPVDKITELLGLSDGMQPSDHIMFEILMYRYKKQVGKDGKQLGKKALEELVLKYDLARERPATGATSPTDQAYFVTIDDLHNVYDQEELFLTDDEKIDILAILVYQLYKGFGILDTLREMDINGFNCGTSGSIMNNVAAHRDGTLKATNSVWLYFKGKYIHLRFMSFGSEDELKRIIQLLIRYNNPGPLTSKRGYLVNTMYDKSRILALRPPASEYWAVFVRKFTISDPSPEALIIKPHTKRGDLPIKMIEFLMRGNITCAVTGRQGSGKTTLMSSIIRFIDPRYTLRILEMAPELYLREIYPSRNILSVQETATVSSADLQDALKKSDAAVSIVGEVATDGIAARMIQMGLVASLFTIFSHHANTSKGLVQALRNSLVNAGGFSNMTTAERQVMEVVKCDIHLDYTADGDRYIERITEIIPLEENIPYPDIDPNNLELSKALMQKEFYERTTDRVSFVTKDILRYNLKTKTYYVVNRPSAALERVIRNNLGDLVLDYDKFMLTEWGRRKDLDSGEVDAVAESMLEYYANKELVETTVVEGKPSIETVGGLVIHEATEEEKMEVVLNLINEEKLAEEAVPKEAIKSENFDLEEHEDAIMMFDFFDGEVKV